MGVEPYSSTPADLVCGPAQDSPARSATTVAKTDREPGPPRCCAARWQTEEIMERGPHVRTAGWLLDVPPDRILRPCRACSRVMPVTEEHLQPESSECTSPTSSAWRSKHGMDTLRVAALRPRAAGRISASPRWWRVVFSATIDAVRREATTQEAPQRGSRCRTGQALR